jgi:hypothetical protein
MTRRRRFRQRAAGTPPAAAAVKSEERGSDFRAPFRLHFLAWTRQRQLCFFVRISLF